MPTSVEVALEGLRSAGEGLQQFGENRRRSKEKEEKADAERIRQERLAEIGLDLDQLAEDAQDPTFDRKTYIEKSAPVRKKIVEYGEPSLLGALTDIRGGLDLREREAREAQKTAKAEKKEETDIALKVTDESRKQRGEERDIKDKYEKRDTSVRTKAIETSYQDIHSLLDAPPSAQNDIAALTLFSKATDPTTGVKQEEFKTAAQAKAWFESNATVNEDGSASVGGLSLPSAVTQIFQKIDPKQRGSFLTPTQKEALKDSMETLYIGQLGRQEAVESETMADVARTPGADPKRVVGKTVAEKRAAIEAKKAERAKTKAAKEKEDSLRLSPEGGGGTAKVMDEAAFQQFFDMNKEPVMAAFQAAEARLGRPLTPEEKNQQIQTLIKAANVQTAPARK